MHRVCVAFVVVGLSVVAGCKKGASADSDAGATAAGATCGAGETKVGEAICITLPAGLQPDAVSKGTDSSGNSNEHVTISDRSNELRVEWGGKSFDAQVKSVKDGLEARKSGGSTGDTGAIPSGGTWFRRIDPDSKGPVDSFEIKGATGGYIACTVFETSKPLPDSVKVCQSIHAVGTPKPAAWTLPAPPAPPPAKPASKK